MDTEPVATIILQGSPGVHHGANETHTVQHNGEPFVIPFGVPTPVPQAVLDVLTDSRLLWTKVDEPEPKAKAKDKEKEDESSAWGKKKTDAPAEGARGEK